MGWLTNVRKMEKSSFFDGNENFFPTDEEHHCYTKKPVEPSSTSTWSYMNNGEPMPAATMPKMCSPLLTRPSTDMQDLEQFQRAEEEKAQPTMSHQIEQNVTQRMPGWTLSNERPENYQQQRQVSTVENSNAMTLPQGSYYGKMCFMQA